MFKYEEVGIVRRYQTFFVRLDISCVRRRKEFILLVSVLQKTSQKTSNRRRATGLSLPTTAAVPSRMRSHEGADGSSPLGASRTMVNEANDVDDVILPNIADRSGPVTQRDDEESMVSSANIRNMVLWRGNLVPEKEAKALHHIFDMRQDHFGHQKADPRIRCSANLSHPGQDGQLWFGDMEFTYDIDGDLCNLAYIGMDVCIDLAPKLVHKHGQLGLKNYGLSWLYVYLPKSTLDKVNSYVKTGTGWDVSTEGTIYDPNRDLVAIEAKMNHQSGQPQPSFWVAKENDAFGVDMTSSFSRLGSIQEVSSQSDKQHIHRGFGIFSVSIEVEGTPNFKPTPRAGDEANLSFTLVSVRTWGVTDCVAPIVHARPSKWYA